MHPRRIPLFLALGLILAGAALLLLPYDVHGRAGAPPDQLELTANCPSPAVDVVMRSDRGWSIDGRPANEGILFAASPGPCDASREERGFAGLALVAGGVLLLVVTRRRRIKREVEAASADAGPS